MAFRPPALDKEIHSINDLKEKGSAMLSREYREYFNEGAMDMLTLRYNEEAFNRYLIRPRILADVSEIDLSIELLGTRIAFPFGFSPAAMHQLAHPEGEVGTSKGAAAVGCPMLLSTYSTMPMEDVIAQGSGNPYGYQISIIKDREKTVQMIRRVEAAGYHAIIVTVDCPVLGRRLNEFRNTFVMPPGMRYPNVDPDADASKSLDVGGEGMRYEDKLNWPDVAQFLRSTTKLPLWLKGVYTPEDVSLAIKYGFNGVIISNHGGRQLDSVPATLDALRVCAPVAKGKIPIGIDSGIRRGTDIFKAIALGADFCLSGRVPIWGLAWNGAAGVELALRILKAEFEVAMSLAGCKTVKDISRHHLSVLNSEGLLCRL